MLQIECVFAGPPQAKICVKKTKIDKSEVMREAHRQYRQMKRFGWGWSRCLSFAWAKAKERGL